MRQRHIHQRKPGQSVVLVALALVVLVGVAGLGMDGANAFNQRRNAQNAADAAAMAGTTELLNQRSASGTNSAVYAAIRDYLNGHGIDADDVDNWEAYYVTDYAGTRGSAIANNGSAVPSRDSGVVGVAVDLDYKIGTYFMVIFGQGEVAVSSTATAVSGPLGSPPDGGDIIPVTVKEDVALDMKENPDDVAIFGTETGAYKGVPGGFGGVNLIPNIDHTPNGNASADCPGDQEDNPRSWWCNGTSHEIDIGDELLSNPGQVSNALVTEIKWRADNRPKGLVPVFDVVSGTGANAKYRIVGFMAIELLNGSGDIKLTGNPDDRHISARFVDYYTTSGSINQDPDAPDTGVYAINLIK